MVKLMRSYDWTIEKPEEVYLQFKFVVTPSTFNMTMRRKQPIAQPAAP